MATRNLTAQFEKFRLQSKKAPAGGRTSRNQHQGDEPLLSDGHGEIRLGIGLEAALPPDWVDTLETIQADLAIIKDKVNQLGKAHQDRLKPTFGEDEEREKEHQIDILTQQITGLMKKSEVGVKRIASVGQTVNLTPQEKTVRLNVMRNLGTQLQALSKQFRTMQKDYILRLKGQEDFVLEDEKGRAPLSIEDGVERGQFSSDQLSQLELMKREGTERQRAIMKVVESVQELAQVFKELNLLVIEQGTVLDRIDYNIEQALVKVKEGTQELQKAENISKKMRSVKCMVALILVIAILVILLVVKKQH